MCNARPSVAILRQLNTGRCQQLEAIFRRIGGGSPELKVKQSDLKSMTVDELWSLHEQVASLLAGKLAAEKTRLEQRLRKLAGSAGAISANGATARPPYPQVFPKYQNPARPSETWAGRGKTPRWLAAQLKSGKKLDDFRIQRPNSRARRSRRKVAQPLGA